MARWLVTQGDRQFTVQDLGELQKLAREGKLGAGDMVQPPGASDWLYASELPELASELQDGGGADDFHDDELPRPNRTPMIIGVLAVLLAVAGYGFYYFAMKVPEAQNLDLFGDSGLQLTEMLVTADPASLRAEPDGSAVGTLPKDSKVALLAKRGAWYEVEADGKKGWVKVDEVVPAYFFADKETRQDYDPIYNPDRYIFVKNASWMQLPDQRRDNITVFQLMLANKSKFDMTDIVLLATIKDKNGKVLETKEVPLEGTVPAYDDTMVGTLAPADDDPDGEPRLMTESSFAELAKDNEDLQLRWSPGIEVKLSTQGFVEANIDMLQVRAIPKQI